MLTKTFKNFLFFLFLFSISVISEANECRLLLTSTSSKVSSEQVSATSFQKTTKSFRVMSYNVQHFYVQKNRQFWGIEPEAVDPRIKDPKHTAEIANIIIEMSPDVIVLQEVETINSLNRFIDNYLGGKYVAFYAGDYDNRTMGTAILIREDSPYYVRIRDTSGITWTAPSGEVEPAFTRELGAFEVYDPVTQEVVFGAFSVHFKSYRDRKGDPASFKKRQKEAEVTAQFVQQFQDRFPGVPFVVAGDYNATPDSPELLPLFTGLDVINPFRMSEYFINKAGLGNTTHSFHPKDSDVSTYGEIDFMLVPAEFEEYIIGADVYRYKDRSTNAFLPLPTSMEDRDKNPSDHNPIFIDFLPDLIDQQKTEEEEKE